MINGLTDPACSVDPPRERDRPAVTRHEAAQRGAWPLAILISAGLFAAAVWISAHRLFWYDELVTVTLAQLPSPAAVWRALLGTVDTMTPCYEWLVFSFVHAIQPLAIAARLPSALAASVGLLLVFSVAKRATSGSSALISAGVLLCSMLPLYAYEARGYATYFLCSAIALLCWTRTTDSGWSGFARLAACFLAGELLHYYFFLCLTPFALEALWNSAHERRPRVQRAAGALAGTVLAILAQWPQVSAIRGLSHNFWAKPTLVALAATYQLLFPLLLFASVLGLMWLALVSRSQTGMRAAVQPSEQERLGWLFLAIPLAGFVLAKTVTQAFHPRYFIGTLPGVGLAASCLVHRLFAGNRGAKVGLIAILVITGTGGVLNMAAHPENAFNDDMVKTRNLMAVSRLLQADGKRYVLHHDYLLFLEADQYASEVLPQVFFADFDRAPERDPTTYTTINLGRLRPLNFWRFPDLLAHLPETALIDPSEALVQALRREHRTVTIRMSKPFVVVYGR